MQIHPSDFHKPSARAIEDYINAKYADKVIHKVGLCVGFHSLISNSEGLIGHGTGIVNVNADFRLVVFRPFKGEIVHATITEGNKVEGIFLSQDFFEDILVPPQVLFEGTAWGKDDAGTEAFIWHSKSEETGEELEFFFDRAERCLYRVEDEQWQDLSPQMQSGNEDYVERENSEEIVRRTPYQILGSMALSGLGPSVWWGESEDEESGIATDGNHDGGVKMLFES